MSNKVYEQVTNKIAKALERAVVPWKKSWTSIRPRDVNGRPYTGINRLHLGMNEYRYPIFLTFKQANDLGGHVKRGEKSHLKAKKTVRRVR